jgi:peptide/nickel transport system permease protein
VQYWNFAKGLIPWPGFFLNEGIYYSWINNVPVKEEIMARLPVTAVLTAGAAVLWLAIGIPIGIMSAVKPGSLRDRAGMVFALVFVSAPIFWLALMLLYLFHFKWGLLPTAGIPPGEPLWESVLQGRFVLPWFSLALTSAAFYSRMVRGNLMETMNEDYIRTARSKGLSEHRVIYKHGLRNALHRGDDVRSAFLLGGAIIASRVPARSQAKSPRSVARDRGLPGDHGVTVSVRCSSSYEPGLDVIYVLDRREVHVSQAITDRARTVGMFPA